MEAIWPWHQGPGRRGKLSPEWPEALGGIGFYLLAYILFVSSSLLQRTNRSLQDIIAIILISEAWGPKAWGRGQVYLTGSAQVLCSGPTDAIYDAQTSPGASGNHHIVNRYFDRAADLFDGNDDVQAASGGEIGFARIKAAAPGQYRSKEKRGGDRCQAGAILFYRTTPGHSYEVAG